MSKFYEGKVTNDSLYLVIPPGGFVSITLISDCSKDECYFQPAIINKTSNHTLEFGVYPHLISHTDLSLLFSANIEQSNIIYKNDKESNTTYRNDEENHSINTTCSCSLFFTLLCIIHCFHLHPSVSAHQKRAKKEKNPTTTKRMTLLLYILHYISRPLAFRTFMNNNQH